MKTRMILSKRESMGFSLMELMVTVAIVAVLATIAYPSYRQQVLKSRRTEAKTALLDMAGKEEQYYSTHNAYSSTPSNLGYTVSPDSFPMTVGSGYYQIAVPTIGTATFSLTANPVGAQAADTACNSFTVDQTGKQSSVDTNTTDTTATCW